MKIKSVADIMQEIREQKSECKSIAISRLFNEAVQKYSSEYDTTICGLPYKVVSDLGTDDYQLLKFDITRLWVNVFSRNAKIW